MNWTFEAIRYIGGKKDAERVIKQYRNKGYEQAVSVKSSNQFGIAFKKNSGKDQFDFATALLLSGKIKTDDSVYLEKLKGNKAVFVRFKGNLVQRSRLLSDSDAEKELHLLYSEKTEPKHVYAHGDLNLRETVEWVREPFTEELDASTDSCFVTSSQILKPEQSKVRTLGTILVLCLVGVALTYFAWPEETKQRIENFTDVNAPYVNSIRKESIDFHTRMLQMYAFHSLFDSQKNSSMHGWAIERVTMGRSATSIRLRSRQAQGRAEKNVIGVSLNPTAGGVQRFIESEAFRTIVGRANLNLTTMSIEIDAINQRVQFDPYNGKYNVRKLYSIFSDVVNYYMPNSELAYKADYPGSLHVKTQSTLEMTGGYIENLIGFGGIIKGYPITFDTAGDSGSVIGQYKISDSGKITGSFAITLIGAKHAN